MAFYAHSANGAGRKELLADHLRHVADRAAALAAPLGVSEEARAAGLLHDLGKFSERFQARLESPATVHGVDHWTPGAVVAGLQYGRECPCKPLALSCVISGHHVGLATAEGVARADSRTHYHELDQSLRANAAKLELPDAGCFNSRFRGEGLSLPRLTRSIYDTFDSHAVSTMLDLRMLFSCLVDADFLETESHFSGTTAKPWGQRKPGPSLQPDAALRVVLAWIESRRMEVQTERSASQETLRLREDLLAACLAAAEKERGIYTLSAPTGSGKTLAMLALALKHAACHQEGNPIRRIVMVIPFLTIIEQTTRIYRKALESHFGPEYIVEDHSQAGRNRPEDARGKGGARKSDAGASPQDGVDSGERARLLAENYDSPIVITTSVQLLESLFANRPKACRKLHSLADSVLLFDEVQTLPAELTIPTLAAVSRLVEQYHCTAVFATATQPAFEALHDRVTTQCALGWSPEEIVKRAPDLFAAAGQRTRVQWRLESPIPLATLAEELALAENARVLCVVNLKRHASELALALYEMNARDGLYHLSTNLCPAHRECVLRQVRKRLAREDQPCRLIATQCIEAGVDVDFPKVYRALAPLEAIVQAAGRCNRGGTRSEVGTVVVFEPEREGTRQKIYPPGYGEAAEETRKFVQRHIRDAGPDAAGSLIHDPSAIKAYFRSLYEFSGNTKVPPELDEALTARDFKCVADEYRLIRGETIRIVVPYIRETYRRLREATERGLRSAEARDWYATASPLSVSIYRPGRDEDTSALLPVVIGSREDAVEEPDCYVLLDDDETNPLYDRKLLGLRGLSGSWIV